MKKLISNFNLLIVVLTISFLATSCSKDDDGGKTDPTATITISNLTHTYDGKPKSVTVKTTPAGLKHKVTYAGKSTPPTDAGTYSVTVTLDDAKHKGSKKASMIINKKSTNITITGLTHDHDGKEKGVTVTTAPKGLKFDVTYNGNKTKPKDAGDYKVVVTINEKNYSGTKQATMSITKKGLIQKMADFKDPRDNQIYPTVKIGNQIWMAKNLAYKSTTGSWAYDNNDSNDKKYGRLYLWSAVKNAIPAGWHLPTDSEWKILEKALGMSSSDIEINGYGVARGAGIGTHLKEGGKSLLNIPMAGFRSGGTFSAMENRTYLWVNSQEGSRIFRRNIYKDRSYVYRFTNPASDFAISVRLVKDK